MQIIPEGPPPPPPPLSTMMMMMMEGTYASVAATAAATGQVASNANKQNGIQPIVCMHAIVSKCKLC